RSIGPIIETVANIGSSIQDRSQPGEVLRQLTYTEKETLIGLDSNGKAKETTTNIYHVIQGAEHWQFYRKLISRNGAPLSEKELANQDREQEKQERKEREQWEREVREAQKRNAGRQPQVFTPEKLKELQERNENLLLDYYTTVFDIRVVRR